MIAVAPEIPDTKEVILAKDQPEYLPLPAAIIEREEGVALITRWQFTEDERAAIASGADLYLELLTFGQPLQPIRICVGDAPDAN
jgi:hypothetical protein